MRKSMKKLWLMSALALAAVAVAAAGCGKAHTHKPSSAWAFNATSHWHPAACSHDVKTNKADHDFSSITVEPTATAGGYTLYICACGYSYTSDEVGSLPVEGEYRFNETVHWKPVLDGEEVDGQAPHDFDTATVEPTCSTYGYTKHFCPCGYWYATDPVEPLPHTYNEEVFDHDESGHWHPALCCGTKSGAVAHGFTESTVPCEQSGGESGYVLYTCTDCGYSYRRETGHSYSDVFEGDEYEHWRSATCSHEAKADVAEHALVGRSNVCVVCGKTVSPRLAYALSENREYYIVTGIGCWQTDSVTIPETYLEKPVLQIADRAFKGEEITSVTFEGRLTKIGADAFADTQISAVNLSGVEELGTRAFAGSKLTSLTLGASLAKLGSAAFKGCAALQTVSIEGSLAALPAYVFENCTSLTSVTGGSLKEIGAQAFSGCTELSSLDLGECEKVGFAAFVDCEKFAPAALSKLVAAEQYAFSGTAVENVALPLLKQLPANLFEGCEKLNTASLSAVGIGASAFEGCTSLHTVALTDTEIIAENVFKGCGNLQSLTLPNSVIRVGEGAFEGTKLISTVDGVRYAAAVAVGLDGGTTSVSLQAGTVGIADSAFRGTGVSSVTLSGSVRFIGVNAFRGCETLTAIAFTESVQTIGASAFRESGLTSVTVPATVISVGDNAFYDCKDLTAVTVAAKKIGRFAFSYTGEGRTLNDPVKERPGFVKPLTLTIGSGVEEIGSNAFQYCMLSSVSLPVGLKTIGKYAFAQTDLIQIAIPASVTFIGEYAFYQCTALIAASFGDGQNWKAGKHALTLSNASQNAIYLKTTYLDYDWIKEVTE